MKTPAHSGKQVAKPHVTPVESKKKAPLPPAPAEGNQDIHPVPGQPPDANATLRGIADRLRSLTVSKQALDDLAEEITQQAASFYSPVISNTIPKQEQKGLEPNPPAHHNLVH